jgi:hypothetical protein
LTYGTYEKKKEGNHMNAGRRTYKRALTLAVAAVCAALTLGGAGAAYAAPPSDSDWTEPKYEKKVDDGQSPVSIAVEGWVIPREAGGGTIIPPSGGGDPETPGVTPPPTGGETPETPGTTPPGDEGTPGVTPPGGGGGTATPGTAETPGSGPGGATAATVANITTQYPDDGASSTPGTTTVPVPGDGTGGTVIDEGDVPLSAGRGDDSFPWRGDSWSLADALFTALCLIAAVACAILLIARRKDEEDERRGKLRWFAVSLAAAAVSILLFILTQDITKQMVIFDKWSICFGVLAAAGVIAARLAFAKQKEAREA